MGKISRWFLIILVLGAVVFYLGPVEKVDQTVAFQPNSVGSDIDSYLTNAEAGFEDMKPGAQKQMIWLDPETKAKQPYSIVYLHGFSATLAEIRPVPELVAKGISANLFYTRFNGHGRSGKAMAEPTVNDWLNDVAEALAIGRATGDKVIVLATSTGGTLASWAATRPSLMKNVEAIVMISPNYAVQAAGSQVLSLPWARQLLPRIFGEEREWEPKNEQQRQWWSTKYPNVALLPMQAAVNMVASLPYDEMPVPALFIFHKDDGVVKSKVTETVAARWGKNTEVKSEVFRVSDSTDTMKHVVAGDILSPENTRPVADKIITWIKSLNN